MKKQDFLFIFVLVIIFLPFFVSESIYNWYKSFNAAHGMWKIQCKLPPKTKRFCPLVLK